MPHRLTTVKRVRKCHEVRHIEHMRTIITGLLLAVFFVTASAAHAEVGGTITRNATPAGSAIDRIVMTVLEFFTWESELGTLTFTDESVGADAGCNVMGGSYELSGTTLDFGDIFSTMMYCDDLMQNETALQNILNTTTHMTFKNGALILIDAAGTESAFKATLSTPAK